MKHFLIILFLLGINSFCEAQHSQIRRAVKNDIELKQENKHAADRTKGEQAVDERLDALDESDKKARAKVQPFPTMSFTMQMEFMDKPKNNGSIHYYFKEFDCVSVMEFERSKGSMDRMIMNFKEGKSVMLMTDKKGKKTGMRMDLKMVDWAAKAAVNKDQKMLENGEASVKATDEYKIIEGYKCRKYLYENEKYASEMWVSTDAKLDYLKINHAMYSVFSTSKDPNQHVYYRAGMKGVTIQTHLMPKDKRMQECIMTMKDIHLGNVASELFSTEGYEIMDMPTLRNIWDGAKHEN